MTDLTVHFNKPADWADTIHVYAWDTRPGAGVADWPGAPMTAEGGGWFVFRFGGIEAACLIFNDNHGRQTGDLWREGEGWYADGEWTDTKPAAPKAAPKKKAPAKPKAKSAARKGAIPKPTGKDFREETIYFLLTTRWNDGDPSNNFFCRDRIKFDAKGNAVDPKTGETVPKPGYNPGRFFGIDVGDLDPEWYHQEGFICGGDWESAYPLQTRHLAGDCIDLATRRQNVKDYIIGSINRYLDMGVDALRIDTVKHVERDNLLEYVNAWKAHKPGLFVFGENLVKGYGWGDMGGGDNGPSEIRPWWYTRLGHDPRDPNSGGDPGFPQLDFGLFSTFRDNLSRGSYDGVARVLEMDWIYGNATELVTFLQNHDVGPDNDFKYRFKGDQWMAAAAYNLLWTARGIPCLYYGEEIEFMKGAPQDVEGERDTLDTTGRAYFGDHLTDERIGETQAHPRYQHIKRLNQIRRAVPALQKAEMSHIGECGGGMSFVRDWNDGESYVVVGLAIGGGQDITVGGVRNGVYRDCVTGNEVHVGDGTLWFHVNGNSAGVYVLDGPGKIGSDGVYLK